MKIKKIELDVDFIGGQGGLTPEEEKALSEFFQNRKSNVKFTKKKKLENKIEQPMPTS